jgi:hypothetical protein
MDAKTGRVQAEGEIAVSRIRELLEIWSMNGVVAFGYP